MVLLAIITSLFVAIQDPIIQKFAVRFASGYLSEKTGADIKVGRLAVTPSFRVFIDDVTVKDLKGNNLARIDALWTKINISDLLDGTIHLEDVVLRGTEANLIQYEGEDKFNFAFLAEAFKSDKEKPEKEPMPIVIDKISLKDVDFVFWNQNKDHPDKTEQQLMDYAHIGLEGINLEATDFFLLGDSVHANVGMLSGKELSGLDLKHFKSDVAVCSKGIFLDGMEMETNNSLFDLDLHMLYDDYSAFSSFVDSVTFDATIRPTDIMLSDIGVFTPVMYQMPDRLQFEGRFTGPIEHFRVDDFIAEFGEATKVQGSLSMHPLDFENGEHKLNIKNMHFTYDDLVNFYIPSKTKTIPLPESLKPMDEGDVSLDFRGSYNNFNSIINLGSGIGNVKANIARSKNGYGDNEFSGSVIGNGVDVGAFAHNSKLLGTLDMDAGFSMRFPKTGSPELDLNGNVHNAEFMGHKINEVKMDGAMKENRFNGIVKVDDDDLALDFNGLVDFEDAKHPQSNFEAVVRHADLRAFNLVKNDSLSEISTRVKVNMKGFNLDDLVGHVQMDSTVYRDSRGIYRMDNFTASIVNDNLMMRRINMNSDFFDFEMAGKMNFAQMLPVFKEYVNYYVTVPLWEQDIAKFEEYKKNHDVEQDFYVDLTLRDTKTLSRLFMPSLKIAKNTTLKGTFTSRSEALNLTLRSKRVQFGDIDFNDIELKNSNFFGSALTTLALGGINYYKASETDTLDLGIENLLVSTRASNDTVFGRIKWDDEELADHNKALIETYLHPHEKGCIFSVTDANICINDSVWTVSPNNFVDWTKERVTLSNLMFSHNQQSIRVDGFVPMAVNDTLSVQLRRFDISNIDFLTLNKGFDIDGFISGDALISNLKEKPTLLADLFVKDLGVNDDLIGDAVVESVWNNDDKAVDLNVNILDQEKKTLNAYGSYYTARKKDNIDFTVEMDSLRLAVISPFLAGVASRVQGYGNGLVTVKGSPDNLNVEGRLKVDDGGCKIGYLNTFYTFSPTILIDNKSIRFDNMVLTDTVGNKATVDGEIRHNHLKDFYLDLKMHPRDFLAMATTSKENETFYGSAVANGLVTVKGPFNDINLDIKALTRRGTSLTIPLNQTSTVKDNDFIIFLSNEEEMEEEEVKPEKKVKTKNNFALNLDVSATDDATLKIILPSDVGTIDASGNGRVKLGTSTTEPLTMRGDYSIKSGRFQLTLFNLITRMFNLKSGGTISWTGDPTDGRINATGAYSVKAPLSGLGIQIDSTAANSNVNVECLIHLKGALLNPTITFGMRLPNATEDVTQTVYALVDTTNQAAMTQQAVSLLVLGQFAYAGGQGGSDLNLGNIFNGGVQVDITDNINLGVSYHSGNADSYDEYQVAMRSQFFEDRLIVETNLGVMTSNEPSSGNASNIVGEFDMYYKLSKDGRLMGHFYNHSNYNSNFNSFSFDRRSPYTQGLGLSYSKSFDAFRNMFKKKSVFAPGQPLIRPKKQEND